jgi:hypothetical protein
MKILKIDVFLKKTSRGYILLGTFERKTAFSAIYKPKVHETARFSAVFVYLGRLGFDFYYSLHHHPLAMHSPRP